MLTLLNKIWHDENAAAAMEYATIASLVAVAVITVAGVTFGSGTGGSAGSMGWALNRVHTALLAVITP